MKEISALDLRKKFGEVMEEVRYRKEPWVVKKNGRPAIVLMDIDSYKLSQERFSQETFIEEYTEERIREFLREDVLDEASAKVVRKTLK